MKRNLLTILLSIISLIPSIAISESNAGGSDGGVAGEVNGKKITVSDIDQQLMSSSPGMFKVAKNDPVLINQLRMKVLNTIIDRALLLQAARSSKENNSKELSLKLEELLSQDPGQAKLSQDPQYKQSLLDSLLIARYVDGQLISDLPTQISDTLVRDELKKHPEQYAAPERIRVQHLLIRVSPEASKADSDAALAKLNKISVQFKSSGATFEQIVRTFSEDEATSKNGGDLGYLVKGMMDSDFEKAALSLKPGEISGPVKTMLGYHLIRVTSREAGDVESIDRVKLNIQTEIMASQKAQLILQKLKELRRTADFKINLQ